MPTLVSELLIPGADVLIREDHIINGYSSLKTKHTLLALKCKGILVAIDSRIPNYILESSLLSEMRSLIMIREYDIWL
jgi:DNA-binding sugar fermentation-stimulating protein